MHLSRAHHRVQVVLALCSHSLPRPSSCASPATAAGPSRAMSSHSRSPRPTQTQPPAPPSASPSQPPPSIVQVSKRSTASANRAAVEDSAPRTLPPPPARLKLQRSKAYALLERSPMKQLFPNGFTNSRSLPETVAAIERINREEWEEATQIVLKLRDFLQPKPGSASGATGPQLLTKLANESQEEAAHILSLVRRLRLCLLRSADEIIKFNSLVDSHLAAICQARLTAFSDALRSTPPSDSSSEAALAPSRQFLLAVASVLRDMYFFQNRCSAVQSHLVPALSALPPPAFTPAFVHRLFTDPFLLPGLCPTTAPPHLLLSSLRSARSVCYELLAQGQSASREIHLVVETIAFAQTATYHFGDQRPLLKELSVSHFFRQHLPRVPLISRALVDQAAREAFVVALVLDPVSNFSMLMLCRDVSEKGLNSGLLACLESELLHEGPAKASHFANVDTSRVAVNTLTKLLKLLCSLPIENFPFWRSLSFYTSLLLVTMKGFWSLPTAKSSTLAGLENTFPSSIGAHESLLAETLNCIIFIDGVYNKARLYSSDLPDSVFTLLQSPAQSVFPFTVLESSQTVFDSKGSWFLVVDHKEHIQKTVQKASFQFSELAWHASRLPVSYSTVIAGLHAVSPFTPLALDAARLILKDTPLSSVSLFFAPTQLLLISNYCQDVPAKDITRYCMLFFSTYLEEGIMLPPYLDPGAFFNSLRFVHLDDADFDLLLRFSKALITAIPKLFSLPIQTRLLFLLAAFQKWNDPRWEWAFTEHGPRVFQDATNVSPLQYIVCHLLKAARPALYANLTPVAKPKSLSALSSSQTHKSILALLDILYFDQVVEEYEIGPFLVDIVLPKAKLAIEVQGPFHNRSYSLLGFPEPLDMTASPATGLGWNDVCSKIERRIAPPCMSMDRSKKWYLEQTGWSVAYIDTEHWHRLALHEQVDLLKGILGTRVAEGDAPRE